MDRKTLTVTVRDKQKVVFEGEIEAISSYNDKGVFDVLALHENYISLIRDKIVLHNKGRDTEIPIDGGIVKVNANVVLVYLGLPAGPYTITEEQGLLSKLKSIKKNIKS